MRQFFSFFLLLMVAQSVAAQELNPDDYIYPLEGVAGLYSANFGELRPDHFHSGVDIKTDGVEGKRVVSVADGYVSRIYLSPYGFGLALYIAHPNGTTSVYAHLSKFRSDIMEYVNSERRRLHQNTYNQYFDSKKFPVKQGDLIAYSGNTGSSAGPHLHFEIRETASQKTLNPIPDRVIAPSDNISPIISKVHYIEVDSVAGVAHNSKIESYDVIAKNSTIYSLRGVAPIPVGRKGYFVVEASDRRNGVANTFGIYQLTASLDGEPYFDYVMDGFTFDRTRFCNAIAYYPLKIVSRTEPLRLAMMENSCLDHYRLMENRGLVTTSAAGELRQMKIVASDDCGNSSTLEFAISGKPKSECFVAEVDSAAVIVDARRNFNYKGDGFSLWIPRNTLYESAVLRAGLSTRKPSERELKMAMSPIYSVFDFRVPLHTAFSLSIDAFVPEDLRSKVGMAFVGRTGNPTFIKAKYEHGRVTASSRSAGDFFVVADSVAPKATPNFVEGADLSGASFLSCSIWDDLSGVASYTATIDGEWVILELSKGKLYHHFESKPSGKKHNLVLTIVDGVGNRSTVKRSFVR